MNTLYRAVLVLNGKIHHGIYIYAYVCIDSNNGIPTSKKYYTKYKESTVDIHRKNTVNKKKYVVQKSPHERKIAAE